MMTKYLELLWFLVQMTSYLIQVWFYFENHSYLLQKVQALLFIEQLYQLHQPHIEKRTLKPYYLLSSYISYTNLTLKREL